MKGKNALNYLIFGMEADNCTRIQNIYIIWLFKKGVAGHTHFHVLRKQANEYCF